MTTEFNKVLSDIKSKAGFLKREFEKANEAEDLVNAVRIFAEWKELREKLEEAVKGFSAGFRKIYNEELPEMFEDEGVESIAVDGYTYSSAAKARASINPQRKPDAYTWLRQEGLGAIITETVNANTLSAAMRDMMEDQGKTPPDDLINVFYQRYIAARKKRA